jgi:hypothetical protein
VDATENVTSAAVPVRLVSVHQIGADSATRIPPDGLRSQASDGEGIDANAFPADETKPWDLDKIPAPLWGEDARQAFIGVAEPGPCTDAFESADADGD